MDVNNNKKGELNMKNVLLGLATGLALVIFVLFFVNGSKNGAIMREEQIKKAKADITVQEKRRSDLIPNLVECVKEYDKHEYETLVAVVQNRKNEENTDQLSEDIQLAINAVAEAYPELKASKNYKTLMIELAQTENLIANYRENYNASVADYNRYCLAFPNNVFLSILNYQIANYEVLTYETSENAPSNLFK